MEPRNTFAFGDGLNDIEMLTEVGTGIAMGNGVSELKKVADYVTVDVDENGIVKGLQQFGLL
ncbi:HAD hydrolase family protein [Lentibacillus sp. Marseille-P4043]|uniref:HAD hydrolase family protein n=1 Tax=Lentibacillus sp. Marseille-P4043 TaxID=2040293 RepID=UPI000D0BA892|nr:HAD hydrolase family protein [Lentibacillus sp. Marseille-P4043]